MATRRQHGEGSLYYRRDRRQWVAVADLGYRPNSDGKPVRDRREFTSSRMEEAREKRQRFLDRRRDGFTMPRGRPPYVSEWMLHWLHNVAKRKVEATTWDRSYRQKVTELIVPWFERVPLPELSEEDVESWHADLERTISKRTGRPLSASTIGQAHRIMSSAIKEAVVRKRIARNPCSNVTPPPVRKAERRLPEAQAVARIQERCRTWPNGARWILALATGLRQGEALALEWRNVQLAGEPGITIAVSAARTSEGLMVKAPKSAQSRRFIPLTPAAVAALREHRKRQLPNIATDLVFTGSRGEPVHPRADWQDWRNLLADLGLPQYRVHDIRHTVATMLLEAGADVRVVQEILGHATPAFTQSAYQQVRPALRRRAVDLLAEAMPASMPAKPGR